VRSSDPASPFSALAPTEPALTRFDDDLADDVAVLYRLTDQANSPSEQIADEAILNCSGDLVGELVAMRSWFENERNIPTALFNLRAR